jgi:hypothetical protein
MIVCARFPFFSPGDEMTDTVYCYHCRCQHFSDEVMLVQTANGRRWRCRKSLLHGQRSQAQRDAFGQTVSQLNRLRRSQSRERTPPQCVLDIYNLSVPGQQGAA